MTEAWSAAAPWLALAALGAYHGINPAMGWLFAVALGLQRGSRAVVLRSLAPIALGHVASVAGAVLLVSGLQLVTAPDVLRPVGAGALIAFGLYKLLRPRSHPRWVGMRLGFWELALWSSLMSTAHGAGLMLFPILLGLAMSPAAATGPTAAAAGPAAGHLQHAGVAQVPPIAHLPPSDPMAVALGQDVTAVLVHTAAMLVTMAVVAVVVYDKVGLAILRRAWVNFDAVWAIAVIVAGVFTFFT